MIKIQKVSVTVAETGQYVESFTLSASIESDSREFLERVSQAIHRELANPQGVEAKVEGTAWKPENFRTLEREG
jgi:hypothetical protein